MLTLQMIEKKDFPPVMEAKEIWEKVIGLDRLCKGNFYELINREGCPKVRFGRKSLIPTAKFIQWFEQESLKAAK